jgi:hypothetical protein
MAGRRIPNSPPPKNNHPIALALEAFEKILDGCKELAATLVLDEFEAQELLIFTENILSLHAQAVDRITLEVPGDDSSTHAFSDEELAIVAARVKTRILQKFAKSGQSHLEIMALGLMDDEDLGKC